ncbi:MAG TPA: cysteine rich repeat-containing protein [Pseudolabrys sp.]|nr:cysteine rich repeat-containing protein [Pseudolabrys sp.]
MIRKLVLAAVLTAASAAMAQAGGTPEEDAACRPDVRRFCHSIPAGSADGVFLACLQQHREKLRRACREVLESHGQ